MKVKIKSIQTLMNWDTETLRRNVPVINDINVTNHLVVEAKESEANQKEDDLVPKKVRGQSQIMVKI